MRSVLDYEPICSECLAVVGLTEQFEIINAGRAHGCSHGLLVGGSKIVFRAPDGDQLNLEDGSFVSSPGEALS